MIEMIEIILPLIILYAYVVSLILRHRETSKQETTSNKSIIKSMLLIIPISVIIGILDIIPDLYIKENFLIGKSYWTSTFYFTIKIVLIIIVFEIFGYFYNRKKIERL